RPRRKSCSCFSPCASGAIRPKVFPHGTYRRKNWPSGLLKTKKVIAIFVTKNDAVPGCEYAFGGFWLRNGCFESNLPDRRERSEWSLISSPYAVSEVIKNLPKLPRLATVCW